MSQQFATYNPHTRRVEWHANLTDALARAEKDAESGVDTHVLHHMRTFRGKGTRPGVSAYKPGPEPGTIQVTGNFIVEKVETVHVDSDTLADPEFLHYVAKDLAKRFQKEEEKALRESLRVSSESSKGPDLSPRQKQMRDIERAIISLEAERAATENAAKIDEQLRLSYAKLRGYKLAKPLAIETPEIEAFIATQQQAELPTKTVTLAWREKLPRLIEIKDAEKETTNEPPNKE